jgi:hypothetical protein
LNTIFCGSSGWFAPERIEAPVAAAKIAVRFMVDLILLKVILVIGLSRIELAGRDNLRSDFAR